MGFKKYKKKNVNISNKQHCVACYSPMDDTMIAVLLNLSAILLPSIGL